MAITGKERLYISHNGTSAGVTLSPDEIRGYAANVNVVAGTNTATVGAVTINQISGRVNIAAAGTSVVVTNSTVKASSHVFAIVSTNDATAIVKNVVPAAGSFTITLNAAATAQTSVDFFVVNNS